MTIIPLKQTNGLTKAPFDNRHGVLSGLNAVGAQAEAHLSEANYLFGQQGRIVAKNETKVRELWGLPKKKGSAIRLTMPIGQHERKAWGLVCPHNLLLSTRIVGPMRDNGGVDIGLASVVEE